MTPVAFSPYVEVRRRVLWSESGKVFLLSGLFSANNDSLSDGSFGNGAGAVDDGLVGDGGVLLLHLSSGDSSTLQEAR